MLLPVVVFFLCYAFPVGFHCEFFYISCGSQERVFQYNVSTVCSSMWFFLRKDLSNGRTQESFFQELKLLIFRIYCWIYLVKKWRCECPLLSLLLSIVGYLKNCASSLSTRNFGQLFFDSNKQEFNLTGNLIEGLRDTVKDLQSPRKRSVEEHYIFLYLFAN